MLLIKTVAGDSRLINPDYIVEIRQNTASGVGSEIALHDGRTILTETAFGELARDLFTKRFVGRV